MIDFENVYEEKVEVSNKIKLSIVKARKPGFQYQGKIRR